MGTFYLRRPGEGSWVRGPVPRDFIRGIETAVGPLSGRVVGDSLVAAAVADRALGSAARRPLVGGVIEDRPAATGRRRRVSGTATRGGGS